MNDRAPVVVVGASGYTGAELLRLLLDHPRARIAAVVAKTSAGRHITQVFPQLTGRLDLTLDPFDAQSVADRARGGAVFCALPHGESAETVAALHARGVTVLDLSADYRLRDAQTYATWYGTKEHPHHPHPSLLHRAVYGLPERHRQALRGATLVAVPGCYPTGAILGLTPLLEANLIATDGIVVDSKSGVSGAGRTPGLPSHFPEVAEGIRAYKIAGTHRHTPEIEQELALAAGAPLAITFTPHLTPMSRGILTCAYAQPTDPSRPAQVYHEALASRWAGEPFIHVLPPGQLPDTAFVRGSNRVHLAAVYDARARRVIVVAAIDNLVKGAAGQAIQCMNLCLGFDETAGLSATALFP